jgi:hypothetical protein
MFCFNAFRKLSEILLIQNPTAVTVTSCGADYILDGAAVLKHSIELSSYPNKNSNYSSKMIAFFHPNAMNCADIFENLGYEIQVKEVPFKVANIKGDYLRKHIDQAGACTVVSVKDRSKNKMMTASTDF